jgi:peptide/nickel transport system permease protein
MSGSRLPQQLCFSFWPMDNYMLIFCLRRLLLGVTIIVLAVTTLYVLVLSAPGDPVAMMLGPRSTPEMMDALNARLGLDQPIIVQIGKFLTGVLTGDLGQDIKTGRDVFTSIMEQLPYTLYLILAALVIAAGLGIPLGCYSALHQHSWVDRLVGILSVSVIAMPSLILAIYGMILFSVHLRWLPAIGVGDRGDLLDQLHHLILPALAVGIGWIGYLARLVRSAMLEILAEDYILNARAYGLPERWVVYKYALRLAVAPTITVLGIGVGYMLGGAVFAEIIFARPGIGKMMFDAVTQRNYPITMGVVLVSTVLMVTTTTLSDIINAVIDPRIRKAQE